jgi:hypothetical protein
MDELWANSQISEITHTQGEVAAPDVIMGEAERGQLIIKCDLGAFHKVDSYQIDNNLAEVVPLSMDTLLEPVSLTSATTRQWLVVKGESELNIAGLTEKLKDKDLAFGIAVVGEQKVMLIRKRRNTSSSIKILKNSTSFGFNVPAVAKQQNGFYLDVLQKFTHIAENVIVNYKFFAPQPKQCIDKAIDAVIAKSKSLTGDDSEKMTIKAKMVDKDSRSLEDSLVVTANANLQKLRKSYEESLKAYNNMKISAFNDKVIPYNEFEKLQNLEIWGVNLDTYEIFKKPLRGFVKDGDWLQYTLVLLGTARMAKTPGAQSVSALEAKALQIADGEEEDD